MQRPIVLKYWRIIRYKTLIIQCVPEGKPEKRFCYESSVGKPCAFTGKACTDCGKTIGDMYEYYDAADGNPLVIFTWVPLANIFILLAGFIIFFINLMSNIKIR